MIASLIKDIQSVGTLKPDLMKSENGNNFRAISEKTILDAIEPIIAKDGIYYTTEIKKSEVHISEAYGKNGKKLIFCANVELKVIFHRADDSEIISTESVGMGIDDNDKAMGKAYTYALKYALIKFFRLRFGDDPDFKPSEPIPLEKPKSEEAKDSKKTKKSENKKSTEQSLTERQRDYILGMMKVKGITSQIIMGKFDGYDPKEDEYIPMTVARAMIKWLEEQDGLPF